MALREQLRGKEILTKHLEAARLASLMAAEPVYKVFAGQERYNKFVTVKDHDGYSEPGYFLVGYLTDRGYVVFYVAAIYWDYFSDIPLREYAPEDTYNLPFDELPTLF